MGCGQLIEISFLTNFPGNHLAVLSQAGQTKLSIKLR